MSNILKFFSVSLFNLLKNKNRNIYKDEITCFFTKTETGKWDAVNLVRK